MMKGYHVIALVVCIVLLAEAKVSRTDYDFIVVGSGTAGSIVASRIAKRLWHKTVLLIEAGGHDSEVPIWDARDGSEFILRSPEFEFMEWNFDTVPQAGLLGRQVFVPRAKILGGCNTHNQMAHLWGNRADWDELATSLGDYDWSWHRLTGERRLTEREMGVFTQPEDVPFFDEMVEASTEEGFPFNNRGYNSGDQFGISSLEQLIHPPDPNDEYAVRETTYDTFVRPLVGRQRNLEVMLNHHVNKLIISNDGSRVTGVEVFSIRRNKTFVIQANKEVIVSAGTFKTPQLLMLSGIGPQQHLTNMGIPTVLDLPGVGQNLQDHPLIFLRYFPTGPPTGPPPVTNTEPPSFFIFGPESSGKPTCEFLATLRSTLIGLLQPRSRGSVTLASLDPLENPLVDPAFMSDPLDLDQARMCTRHALNIYKRAVQNKGVPITPAPFSLPFTASDADIDFYIRNFSASLSHPTGTCKMGLTTDPMAVVDTNLRVIGIDGLRVIDASVFPEIPSANTNSPTILVALKGADEILREHWW